MSTETQATEAAEAICALLPPIFRECCDPEAIRFDLSLPRPIGDHVYASDGRIAVRVAATPEIVSAIPPLEQGKRFLPKSLPSLFAGHWDDSPTPLPDPASAPICPRCKGKRRLARRRCGSCGGRGKRSCLECGHVTSCRLCDGEGVFPAGPCEDCGASGIEHGKWTGVEVGKGVTLAWRFVEMLTRHGASLFLPVDPGPAAKRSVLRFVLPGDVEGIVMPMSRAGE